MTELADPDNLTVYMPNGKVFGEMIVNYSTPAHRRMELNFSVDYTHDLDRAKALLIACAKADPRILGKPAPWARVTALTESAVTVTLRAWATLDVYWEARFDLLQRVSEALQSDGLEHPYPHQVSVEKKPAAPRAAPTPPAPREGQSRPDASETPSQGGT
jgi:small conductance mechanosensitive channel